RAGPRDRSARTPAVQCWLPRSLSDANRARSPKRRTGVKVVPVTGAYAAAGVDIAAAEENVRRIGAHVRSTHGPAVLGHFGAFAGLFYLKDVQDPVLVASTDGVGSKVLLGLELGCYDVLGRDLV